MNIEYHWKKTDKHVYGAIYREHYEELVPFATFTSPEGCELSSNPEIMTEWGFKKSEVPLIKLIKTKKDRHQEEWDCEYFICIVEGVSEE